MRTICALLCSVALFVPAVGSAQTTRPGSGSAGASRAPLPPPSASALRAMLSGVEDVPSDESMRRYGREIVPRLIALYRDERQPPYVRLRAMNATAAFAEADVRRFLLSVARTPDASDLHVRRALFALARGFGPSVTTELASFLEHEQRTVREAAARSLGEVGGRRAQAALDARRDAEPDPTVREAIDAARLRLRN